MSKYVTSPYAEHITRLLNTQGLMPEVDPEGRAAALDARILSYVGDWFRVTAELDAATKNLRPGRPIPRDVEDLVTDLDFIERALTHRVDSVLACAENQLHLNPDPTPIHHTLPQRLEELRRRISEAS